MAGYTPFGSQRYSPQGGGYVQDGGRRAGVGLVLEARGRGPATVAQLSAGGAAEACGLIRIGDTLTRINGKSVAGLTPLEISNIIGGQENTQVLLAFKRVVSSFFSENEEPYEVNLVRGFSAHAAHQQLDSHPNYAPRSGLHSSPGHLQQQYQANGRPNVPHLQAPVHTHQQPDDHQPPVYSIPHPSNMLSPQNLDIWPQQHQPLTHFTTVPAHTAAPPPAPGAAAQGDQGDAQDDTFTRRRRQRGALRGGGGKARSRSQSISEEERERRPSEAGVPHARGGGGGGEGQAEALREQMGKMVAFLKSGYTNSNEMEDSPFLSESPDGALVGELYHCIKALKAREASSENVLRVAKETLDARKKQIKTLTIALKKLQAQMGGGHGGDRVAVSGMGLSGSLDGASKAPLSTASDGDGSVGDDELRDAQAREQRALQMADASRRKLAAAIREIQSLKQGGGGGAKDARIEELERKLAEAMGGEGVALASEKLAAKRRETKELMEHVESELAAKESRMQEGPTTVLS